MNAWKQAIRNSIKNPVQNLVEINGNKLLLCAISLAAVLAVFFGARLHAEPADDFLAVSGSGTYRQRVAMSPEAVLAVLIEDVSRADGPARLLVETPKRRAHLVPIRHARILASPFAFLRGSTVVLAQDLSTTPTIGLHVED